MSWSDIESKECPRALAFGNYYIFLFIYMTLCLSIIIETMGILSN